MLLKMLFMILGTLSLGLGILGIFLPVLPTTPFLLLTAGLYVRSSDRLYHGLVNHRILGMPVRQYKENGGIALRARNISLIMMWGMILASFFLINEAWLQVLLLILGLAGTLALFFLPLADEYSSGNSRNPEDNTK